MFHIWKVKGQLLFSLINIVIKEQKVVTLFPWIWPVYCGCAVTETRDVPVVAFIEVLIQYLDNTVTKCPYCIAHDMLTVLIDLLNCVIDSYPYFTCFILQTCTT